MNEAYISELLCKQKVLILCPCLCHHHHFDKRLRGYSRWVILISLWDVDIWGKKKKKLVFKSVLMYASFLQRTLINISSFKPTVWSGTGWGSKVTSLFQLPPWWSTALWSAGEVISAVSNSAAHSLALSNTYTPLQVGHTHVCLIVRR